MFRQAGVIQVDTLDEMFDVAQLLAHQPLPRGRRVAIVGNSDALGLLAADAAAAVGLVVNRSVALGADATGRGLRGRPRRGDRRPRGRLGGRRLHPADRRLRRRGRRRAGRRGGAVRQAAGLVVPRRRGRPRAAPGARRRRARRPAAARCRRTPRSRPPCARSPASSSTPCGCAPRTARPSVPDDIDPAAAKGLVHRLLIDAPRRRRARRRRPAPRCWRRTASSCGRPVRSRPSRRRRRPAATWAGTSCSRRPPTACASGPTWPTCGATSTAPAEMKDAWESLGELIDDADSGRLRRPEERPARRAGEHPQHRGPAVRAGRVLRHLRAAHRAARGPVLPDPAARRARRRRDDPRDQGRADAVRLPRLRGRRRRAGRGPDPPRRPAPARPAAGLRRSSSRWCWPVPTARPCSPPAPGSTRSPTRAPTGSCAGCRPRSRTPSRADPGCRGP